MLVKFEQNPMVPTTQYFELSDKKKKKKTHLKKKNIFDKALAPFWERRF